MSKRPIDITDIIERVYQAKERYKKARSLDDLTKITEAERECNIWEAVLARVCAGGDPLLEVLLRSERDGERE